MLKDIINDLLFRAWHLKDMHKTGKVGELVNKLTPEEREILKTAKASDFNHEMLFRKK